MRLILLLITMFTFPSCISNSSNTTKCEPVVSIVYDTVKVHDTLYIFMDPPTPGAPIIFNSEISYSTGSHFIYLFATPVENAIGYKAYESTSVNCPYNEIDIITPEFSDEYVKITNIVDQSISGLFFYKITAVNNDGIEGPKSNHRAILLN